MIRDSCHSLLSEAIAVWVVTLLSGECGMKAVTFTVPDEAWIDLMFGERLSRM